MRYLLWLLVPVLLLGCNAGAYKISKEEYRERVRTLGVLPLMVDSNSAITHPERSRVIELLRRHNAGKEEELIARLRQQKGYFDVREIAGDPQQLFSRLVSGTTLRGKGDSQYVRYHFNAAVAREITAANMVDGLLVVIMSGLERTETRRDRGPLLAYLEAPYNPVLAAAAVVLPSGEIAWEYAPTGGESFLHLQYPAFDEAFYNKTDEVQIKFISVDGLERTLAEPDRKLFGGKKVPRLYGELFDRLTGAMHPGLLNPLRSKESTQ
ncbi:MAG: hypothetical protein IH614_02845 [Desulfuromonadales bacterium]|nr:hypothetical protein [Desulfuromonadales bacterium]